MCNPSRREFLKSTVTTACSAGLSVCGFADLLAASPASRGTLAPAATLPIKKGVLLDMLPVKLSIADRMKMARDVGFEVMQAPTTPDEHKAEEIKKAADGANIRIDSVMNMDHWKYPLSSSDPAVVEKSLAGMRTSLRNAKLWGSDVVLLVPAVVNPQTSYRDAWSRSQKEIRELLPLAVRRQRGVNGRGTAGRRCFRPIQRRRSGAAAAARGVERPFQVRYPSRHARTEKPRILRSSQGRSFISAHRRVPAAGQCEGRAHLCRR